MNRWLKSRMMVICIILCVMAYAPAIWPWLGGELMSQWISVFGAIAGSSIIILGGKNALDSYKHGPYRGQDAPYEGD